MSRLIDADEFSRKMYHEAFETDSDLQKWDSGCWIRYKMFENAIENFPTVDAVPVVHGHWIKIGSQDSIRNMKCSICGEEVFGDADTEILFQLRIKNGCSNAIQ